jgi:phytoene dehydrogenase-like protein
MCHAFGFQFANLSPVLEELGLADFGLVYLCGSGSHPGPGITRAPGRNAAQVMLSDLSA